MKMITFKPATTFGWWAIGLAVAYLVLMPLWSFMGPLGAGPAFVCGLAGGICGLVAVIRQKERSLLVYLTILPLLFVFVFIAGEFIFPH